MRTPIDGAALRRELAIRGLSQAEFADESGISQATLSHAICGHKVDVATVRKLARGLVRTRPMPGAAAIFDH